MSDRSPIGWTDATWNMIRAVHNVTKKLGWCCVRVSGGCVNCYAAGLNGRLGNGEDYTVPGMANVTAILDETALMLPTRWRAPRRVFVCSMTDLFGEWVSDEWIARVFGVMRGAKRHTFQILTKRPERMRAWFSKCSDRGGWITHNGASHRADGGDGIIVGDTTLNGVGGWPLPNVWLGVSVEDQATADERIPLLLQTPAAVRWVSYEPALGPVDFRQFFTRCGYATTDHFACCSAYPHPPIGLDWIVVGGESGAKRRAFDLAWLESTVTQCESAGVPIYVKQDGASRPGQRRRIPDHLWRHEYPSLVSA